MLALFADGGSQAEVADALGIRERMVRYRLGRVLNYTGVIRDGRVVPARNVTAAVAEAIRRGWID